MNRHTYQLGLIGNCSYIGYVDCTANITWLCLPRFDSQFIFGSLIQNQKINNTNSEFSVRPSQDEYTSKQYYLENTNILCTEFENSEGKFRVVDFAPRFLNFERYFRPLMVFRKIEILEGQPKIKVVCRPVDGVKETKIEHAMGSNHIRYLGFSESLRLTTNIPLTYIMNEKEFVMTENSYLVLSWGIPLEAPLESTFEEFFEKTRKYWNSWSRRCAIPQKYQKEVLRSALTLKLHQYEDTGAIIAAGTTSLPEHPGGGRNWDYRYCWIRDAHYTLDALNSLSHFEEMEKFSSFIQNIASATNSHIQPVYGIDGRTELPESIEPLSGYMQNQPVRFGNLAHQQIQNDAYGQILLSLFHLYHDRRLIDRSKKFPKELVLKIFRLMEQKFDEQDAGLWELRNQKSQSLYSYLFHWAGSKATFKLGQIFVEPEIMEVAQKMALMSERRIFQRLNELDDQHLDASLLQLVNMGFLAEHPHEAKKIVERIEKNLKIKEGFLRRYNFEDDFGKMQSAFLLCCFWYVESLLKVGRVEEGTAYFEQILGTANSLGLMSEDIDPENLSQWGNFPQTYSHVGIINCAFLIDRMTTRQAYL